jgi:hypothetical protein
MPRKSQRPVAKVAKGSSAVAACARRKGRKGGDSYKQTWDQFNDQLRHYGLQLRHIGGDGACLFRSIADQLLGDQERHNEIRQQICDYVRYRTCCRSACVYRDIDPYTSIAPCVLSFDMMLDGGSSPGLCAILLRRNI